MRIVAPFLPGGPSDVLARTVALLAKDLGITMLDLELRLARRPELQRRLYETTSTTMLTTPTEAQDALLTRAAVSRVA